MSDGSDSFFALLFIGGAVGAFIYVNSNSTEQNIAYCHQESACNQYSKARQECAVAGDFNNCVAVKVGVTDVDVSYACASDGSVLYSQPDHPNTMLCEGINLKIQIGSWMSPPHKK
jgi:hypothetical protein